MRTNLLKRAFSFLLIAIMVATALPTGLIGVVKTAKAEAQQMQVETQEPTKATKLNTVRINDATLNAVIGYEAGECDDYELESAAKYTVTNQYWYDHTIGSALYPDDLFVAGHECSRLWILKAAEGYEFISDAAAFVNSKWELVDEERTAVDAEDPTIFRVWTKKAETVHIQTIDTIEIIDAIVIPTIGKTDMQSYAGDIPDDANYDYIGNYWYYNADGTVMHTVFEADTEYYRCWEMVADVGYVFAEDVTVTINGSTVMMDMVNTTISDETASTFYVRSLPVEAQEYKVIDTITITDACVVPTVGKKSYECTAYSIPEDVNYSSAKHYWQCDTLNQPVAWDGGFIQTYEYSAGWKFKADYGYKFAEDTQVTINGNTDVVDVENTAIVATDPTTFNVWTLSTLPNPPRIAGNHDSQR